ncbi:hypothetical protein SOVF_076820 [Spinacia oleracea]|nr:hypothetical protein SOVF_076820 [Spinacia oleracea]
MEIAGMVLSAAQTLFAALQCNEVKQICSILGCKSQLNDLSGTVVRIKAALEDAEAKQDLSKQDRLFIEELKDAVYDADDLFDEFVTLAEQEKLTKGIKVRVLALFGKYGKAYKMAQEVKMIKKKLDAIAFDTRFNFNIDPKPIRDRRLETCSYVYEADIIGRESDLEKIVDDKIGVSCVGALLANWKYLRALFLKDSEIESLPGSIGELIHLRYLDLSNNKNLEVLPEPITKLHNLQILNLILCSSLKELPKDLSKLVKLRVLDLSECNVLSYMPRGMGKLTCLHTLNKFVVGDTRSNKELFSGLEDLKALRNLKGFLEINIPFTNTGVNAGMKNGGREGGCLGNKEHLKQVYFNFSGEEGKGRVEYNEAVMGELQPEPNLEIFLLSDYHGVRMPCWPMEDKLASFLPNLVSIVFCRCPYLQYSGQLRLPLLKTLAVNNCPNLIATLQCPALEDLTLINFNKKFELVSMRSIESKEFGEAIPSGIPASSSSFSYDIGLKLREVETDNVAWLKTLLMGVVKLIIWKDNEVESLGEAREMFCSSSSSLKFLVIYDCYKLKSVVFGGLEHLTALETLEIYKCPNLSLEEVEREDGMPWQPIHHTLCTLYLDCLPRLVDLPNWIQYLTSLKNLMIKDCKGLESMPNWMSKLTSLELLKLLHCSERLNERCRPSTGEDWAHIQHIPLNDIPSVYRNKDLGAETE